MTKSKLWDKKWVRFTVFLKKYSCFFPTELCSLMAHGLEPSWEKDIISFPPNKQKNKTDFDSIMHLVKFH